jgi:hypothetical protein
MGRMSFMSESTAPQPSAPPCPPPAADMAWVPGGSFLMGSEDFYPEERPAHPVHVIRLACFHASWMRGRPSALSVVR